MREIVLDTETTGLDPHNGDRVVEIGCVELANHIPTGKTFHCYIDPQRDMPQAAFEVHGLSAEFLSGKPLFADVMEDFLGFIGDDPLIIHNASFDISFLNAELEAAGSTSIAMTRVTDTLALARRKHPGASNSLDALCRRYGIDNSDRTLHGALIDCSLLAAVYIELVGGHQADLELTATARSASASQSGAGALKRPEPLPARLTDEERAAHRKFVATLGPTALWVRFWSASGDHAG